MWGFFLKFLDHSYFLRHFDILILQLSSELFSYEVFFLRLLEHSYFLQHFRILILQNCFLPMFGTLNFIQWGEREFILSLVRRRFVLIASIVCILGQFLNLCQHVNFIQNYSQITHMYEICLQVISGKHGWRNWI